MRKIEPELITGMGYIGDNPGVLYRMGGAGEQTVVTGNPALLEGVKGSRITALTLHGGSTQGSTTGAQLLNTKELITGYYDNSGGITILDARLSAPKIHIPTGTTKISISGLADNISALYVVENAEGAVIERNVGYKKQHTISISPESKTIGVSFYNDAGIRITADMLSSCMINFGDIKPFEPYTGGAPSPSPSYPQEIENAGMDGEIGVEVLGKNLIPFPYPLLGGIGAKGTKNGVTWEILKDRGIKFTGKVTGDVYIDILLSQELQDRKKFAYSKDLLSDARNGKVFYAPLVGQSINTIYYPQIELGTVATSYEPYKPTQSLIIPTPGGLPGIPVSSGGNYTDEKGQQWVCDEIDLAKGERVQWIEKLDLKSLSWAKQSRMSNAGGFWFSSKIKSASLFGSSVKGTISNIGICKNPYTDVGDYVWTLTNVENSEVRIGFTDSTIDTLEKLTNLLNSLPEAYAMYCLAEPIRTPLPPETIAAYKVLRTYSPTTTIVNDAGAGMSVRYRRK